MTAAERALPYSKCSLNRFYYSELTHWSAKGRKSQASAAAVAAAALSVCLLSLWQRDLIALSWPTSL